MSSASRSKNISSKLSGNGNGYYPVLGNFHVVETSAPSSVSPLHICSHFGSIDETNDPYGISIGSGKEYDTVSNNSSWSGDSEDHKDKPPHRIPPTKVDNEKREKIRQKNEKKHQRQKERRAQELHDRCTGFLMSRKLETLSQQLVAMGFSSNRATVALTMNQGKIEESILWLIEEGESADKHKEYNLHACNSKVDISAELGRIAEMEIRYKCSKQEVERAIVSWEGDLEKAEVLLSASQCSSTTQLKPSLSTFVEHEGGEKNFSCTIKDVAKGVPSELEMEHLQDKKKPEPKLDFLPSSQLKSKTQYVVLENEFNYQQLGKRDTIVLTQRPQSDSPSAGNLRGCILTNHMHDEDQYHRQVRFNNRMGNKKGNSPAILVVSSLGLYSGSGSTSGSSGSSSPVDWNSVGPLLLQLNYTNVDWTLNPSPPRSKTTGMWQGMASAMENNKRIYDLFPSAVTTRSGSFREWSSPFEERDIFSLPRRHFFSPPNL